MMTTKQKSSEFLDIWTELRDPQDDFYRSGHAVIVQRIDVPMTDLQDAVNYSMGEGWSRLIVEIQHLAYTPRVKWCGRRDWACDNEGEWHGHWFAVRHNPQGGCCYTLAMPVYPWAERLSDSRNE